MLFLLYSFKIHLYTSFIFWILPTVQVSNNPNIFEVLFVVNCSTYLKYTGSFAAFNSADPAASEANPQVTGLQTTTTAVEAYKVIVPSYDATTGAVTYALAPWVETAILADTTKYAAYVDNGKASVEKVLAAIGADTGVKNGQEADGSHAKDLDQQTATRGSVTDLYNMIDANVTYDKKVDAPANLVAPATWDATFTDLPVGAYIVKAVDGSVVYNPMMISVGLTADDNGAFNGVYPNSTVAKFSDVPFDKKVDGDGNPADKGGDKAVGDTVNYTLTSKVPNYDLNSITSPVFTMYDKLDNGLTPPADTDIKVYINGTEVTDYSNITRTVSGQDITVDLSGIIDATTLNADVEVKYPAVLNQSATTGFDANKNKAYLEYSHKPGETSKSKEIITYTYTFAIDGSIWANMAEDSWELKKTGEGKWEKINNDVIVSENKALDGAWFTIYTKDTNGNLVPVDVKNLKGANPYETQNGDGRITFEGLDGNTKYYIKETEAPSGYSLNTKVYEIEFVPTYDGTEGKMVSYQVKIDGTVVADYKYVDDDGTNPAHIEYNGGCKWNGTTGHEGTTEIKNTKLVALPSTGGVGTTIFTVTGVALMILAAAMLLVVRRAKEQQ